MSVEHWMSFGTFAEQRHFEYPEKGVYAGVLINANMAAHAPAGLAAFLLERTAGMRYIVDPLTHAFQHSPEAIQDREGQPKSSIRTLAEAYGEPVSLLVGEAPLIPDDLADAGLRREFVQRCLAFQSEQLRHRMEESRASKYLDDEKTFTPYALIPPYFYLSEATLDDWLEINLDCVRQAEGFALPGGCKRFAGVVVSQGVLTNPRAREKVAEAYRAMSPDGFLLWVDDLDEQVAGAAELKGLLAIGESLRKNGSTQVINLHGGYFSVLAAGMVRSGVFTGVAHGPEFGEHREVVPVGGGIPIARYYVPELHARIRYREALRMFSAAGWLASAEDFHGQVCSCSECMSVLGGEPANFGLFGEGTVRSVRRRNGVVRIEFPTGDTKLRCLRHYLQRKHREYAAAGKAGAKVLLGNLEEGERKFRKFAGLDGVAHLRLWRSVLAECGDL